MSAWRSSRQHDAHAGVEEGQLAQAVLERGVVELGDVVERLGARQEGDLGAALVAGVADHLERRLGTPLRKRTKCSLPSRQILSSSTVDSALTTETPTPCRPPETL